MRRTNEGLNTCTSFCVTYHAKRENVTDCLEQSLYEVSSRWVPEEFPTVLSSTKVKKLVNWDPQMEIVLRKTKLAP